MVSTEMFGRYKTKVEDRIVGRRKRPKLRTKVESDKLLEKCGGSSEAIEIKAYLHDPMDLVNTMKLRFRASDLDLPESRNKYTSSREKE